MKFISDSDEKHDVGKLSAGMQVWTEPSCRWSKIVTHYAQFMSKHSCVCVCVCVSMLQSYSWQHAHPAHTKPLQAQHMCIWLKVIRNHDLQNCVQITGCTYGRFYLIYTISNTGGGCDRFNFKSLLHVTFSDCSFGSAHNSVKLLLLFFLHLLLILHDIYFRPPLANICGAAGLCVLKLHYHN